MRGRRQLSGWLCLGLGLGAGCDRGFEDEAAVDRPPAIEALTLSDPALIDGDVLRVQFRIDAMPDSEPSVTLSGVPAIRVGQATEPFEYSLAISPEVIGEGSHELRVTALVRGLVASVTQSVVVDYTPPALNDHRVMPTEALYGERLEVELSFDEALGDVGMDFEGRSGEAFTCEAMADDARRCHYTLATGDPAGTLTLQWTAQDEAGNSAEGELVAALRVVAPATTLSVTTNLDPVAPWIGLGATLEVELVSDHPLTVGGECATSVSLGEIALSFDSAEEADDAFRARYRYSFGEDGAEGSGERSLDVAARDRYCNPLEAPASPAVRVDLQAPQLLLPEAAWAVGANTQLHCDAEVTIAVDVTDNGTIPEGAVRAWVTTAQARADAELRRQEGTRMHFAAALPYGCAAHEVHIEARDLAGNVALSPALAVARPAPVDYCAEAGVVVGGSGTESIRALAPVGSEDDVVLVGSYEGAGFETGCERPLPEVAGRDDIWLQRVDLRTGECRWASSAGGTEIDHALEVAVDGDGVYVAGIFASGSLDLGCGPMMNLGRRDIYFARFDAETGICQWAEPVGLSGTEEEPLIAAAAGRVFVAGDISSASAQLSDCSRLPVPEPFGSLLGALDADSGDCAWSLVADTIKHQIRALAATPDGDLLVAGILERGGRVDYGCAALAVTQAAQSYVARLDGATGVCRWLRPLEGDEAESIDALGLGPDAVVLSGSTNSRALDAGCSEAIAGPTAGAGQEHRRPFVAALALSDGACRMLRGLPDQSQLQVPALDYEGDQMLLGGTYRGTAMDLGCGDMTNPNPDNTEIFVAGLDATSGACRWSKSLGTRGFDLFAGLRSNERGEILLGGTWLSATQPLEAGCLSLPRRSSQDGFVLRLTPAR